MTPIYFPGSDKLKKFSIDQFENKSILFGDIFESIINLLEMTLSIFIVCTLRIYENEILNEPETYKKKTKYIKKIIREKFKSPSLGTLLDLARNCVHLVDEKDMTLPKDFVKMKLTFVKSIKLGPISYFLNDLYEIIKKAKSQTDKKAKTKYFEINKLNLLNKILPEIVYFRNHFKHSRDLILLIEENTDKYNLELDKWILAYEHFLEIFKTLCDLKYKAKQLGKINRAITDSDSKTDTNLSIQVHHSVFTGGKQFDTTDEVIFSNINEIEDYQTYNHSEIVFEKDGKEVLIDIFPFLIIQNNKLYFYKTTKAKGYEYFSIINNSFTLFPTKKKFNHTALKTLQKGDQQAFFWTEAPPRLNPVTQVKSNIPLEGLIEFVGRRKQLKKIMEEIIEIPNQNGILYGPGGVGKTALMIQLSKELLEKNMKKMNAISLILYGFSKRDYYNPFHNVIEIKEKNIESLDHIFSAVLSFFDFEDIDEYEHDDKKSFCLEIIHDR